MMPTIGSLPVAQPVVPYPLGDWVGGAAVRIWVESRGWGRSLGRLTTLALPPPVLNTLCGY